MYFDPSPTPSHPLTSWLFSAHQHIVPRGVKDQCLDAGHLLHGPVRPLHRGLGVVKELHRAVVAPRGQHGEGGVEVQRQNSLSKEEHITA